MTKNTTEMTVCTHRKTIYSGHVTPNREDDESTMSTGYSEDMQEDKMTKDKIKQKNKKEKKDQKEKKVKWKG